MTYYPTAAEALAAVEIAEATFPTSAYSRYALKSARTLAREVQRAPLYWTVTRRADVAREAIQLAESAVRRGHEDETARYLVCPICDGDGYRGALGAYTPAELAEEFGPEVDDYLAMHSVSRHPCELCRGARVVTPAALGDYEAGQAFADL